MNNLKMHSQAGQKVDEYQSLSVKDDRKAEKLLQANTKTPLGQLLEKIAQLPEVRYEKVLNIRRQICRGQYQVDEKLDAAIDKILEELLI